MSKKTEIPLQLRRRTHLLDRVIDNLLPNMYPCDYNSSDHFVEGVLDEIRWFLVDVEELRGVERTDIEDYIFDYKYDEITNYFNERCGDTKKDNLQESIRRILKETREDKLKSFLFQRFDKVFDELNLKVDYEEDNYVYGIWYDKDEQKIFHRNSWGVLWITNCEPYKELYSYSKLVGIKGKEFKKIFVEYLNNKYLDQFLQKPFKTVGDESHCLEDEY